MDIKETWGPEIAALLPALEKAGVLIETPQRCIVAVTEKYVIVCAKKGGGDNGSFKVSIAGMEFFTMHFVSNSEALFIFQHAGIDTASWIKGMNAANNAVFDAAFAALKKEY